MQSIMEKKFLEAEDRINKKFNHVMERLDELEKKLVDLKNMMIERRKLILKIE